MNEFPEYKTASVENLIPYARNSRTHSDEQVAKIAASIKEFGFTNPVLTDGANGIIAGHGRVMAAQRLGLKEVPIIELDHLDENQKRAYIIADNRLALDAGWDNDMLRIEFDALEDVGFDLDLTGFELDEIEDISLGDDSQDLDPYADGVAGSMEANFGQPPFSILDTRKGSWLDRKRGWHTLIGDQGESREGALAKDSIMSDMNKGVSILDPVMAELVVKWFGFSGGVTFDPFAGDSVYGFVSAASGMQFLGIELRKEQADLNQ